VPALARRTRPRSGVGQLDQKRTCRVDDRGDHQAKGRDLQQEWPCPSDGLATMSRTTPAIPVTSTNLQPSSERARRSNVLSDAMITVRVELAPACAGIRADQGTVSSAQQGVTRMAWRL
jgi:hypothetical protein